MFITHSSWGSWTTVGGEYGCFWDSLSNDWASLSFSYNKSNCYLKSINCEDI